MFVRWDNLKIESEAETRLPGYREAVIRTFDAPEALDTRFYEVRAKSTLNRVFTEAYGTGVAARYLALRLEIAKGLLGAGDKVESVATSVGFASPRAFREAFIKSTGCRPGGFVPGRSGFTPVPFRLSTPAPAPDATSSRVN